MYLVQARFFFLTLSYTRNVLFFPSGCVHICMIFFPLCILLFWLSEHAFYFCYFSNDHLHRNTFLVQVCLQEYVFFFEITHTPLKSQI